MTGGVSVGKYKNLKQAFLSVSEFSLLFEMENNSSNMKRPLVVY